MTSTLYSKDDVNSSLCQENIDEEGEITVTGCSV